MKVLRTPPSLAVPAGVLIYGSVDIALPILLSQVSDRTGWNGRPNLVNLLGAPLIAAGAVLILWSAAAHATAWRAREWRVLRLDPQHVLTPDYLVTDGPYQYTRNPLYIGDLVMWAGWAVLFGSAAVAAGVVALVVGLQIGVRLEERGLARRFDSAWRHYAAVTPRFIGRRRGTPV